MTLAICTSTDGADWCVLLDAGSSRLAFGECFGSSSSSVRAVVNSVIVGVAVLGKLVRTDRAGSGTSAFFFSADIITIAHDAYTVIRISAGW